MHEYFVKSIPITKYAKIADLPIERADAMQAQFGQKLNVTRLIELIRETTADFQLEVKEAIEADNLIKRFLEKKGFGKAAKPVATVKKPVEKEQSSSARKRKLQTKIKGFEAALTFAEGAMKTKLETKIKGFNAALAFA